MAEHQVMSCIYSHNSYTNDFVSHQAIVRCLGGCAATHVKGTVEVLHLSEVFVTLALTSFLWTAQHF